MVFSSISFIYYFLPAVIIIYFVAPKKLKNLVLLLFSLFFYFCGEQMLILVMLFSALVDYCCSLVIDKYRSRRYIPKIALMCSLVINLGLLCYFKYSDFLIENINALFGTSIPLLNIALPIGISFYTFQTMSYTIDVYHKETEVQRNLINFAAYVTLFPQLIAGPIVRYTTVNKELNEREHSFAGFSYGVRRFIIGLSKKVLLANTFAELGNTFIYSDEKTVLFYWINVIAFGFQVYFDFSGYSDMAIGLGKMFGFNFLENFNYPYISKSVSEFWRRWHISMGTWFRDYVYFPLGGSRVSKLKLIRNIAVVWFLTGFWHGAAWNFILWGIFYAIIMPCEKKLWGKLLERAPIPLRHIYTIFITLIGYAIFNANNATEAFANLGGMFGANGIPFSGDETMYYIKSYAFLFILAAIASTPLAASLAKRLHAYRSGAKILNAAEIVVMVSLLFMVTGFLVDGSFNPFIYFRF